MNSFTNHKMWILNAVTFLSAFLLFQIELILAKTFLPSYGGSYLVWGACIVFFQAALLIGYLFSHIAVNWTGMKKYRIVHLILLFIPLLFFPGRPIPGISLNDNLPFAVSIFYRLCVTIGPVFFVLSTVSLILQRWLAASDLEQRKNPYALYAVSNFGSFSALLTYPFIFEVFTGLGTQILIWRVSYLVLIALSVLAFFAVKVSDEKINGIRPKAVGGKQSAIWFLFGAGGVMMFLSVTNILTYQVAPFPLLWVLPLSIYLLSYVLNFKQKPWCPGWIPKSVQFIVGFSILLFFMTNSSSLLFIIEFVLYIFLLFAVCMLCQNRLFLSRPKDEKNLTLFYVIVSFGGFAGGIFVSWIVPLISTSLIEYLLGLLVICFALSLEKREEKLSIFEMLVILYGIIIMIMWPAVLKKYSVIAAWLIFFLMGFIFYELKNKVKASVYFLIATIFLSHILDNFWSDKKFYFKHRNYYGIHKITEKHGVRFLAHGSILHGAQALEAEKKHVPLTYFHPLTPVGDVLKGNIFKFREIGIIGLGAGSLAAYSRTDQNIDYFELDEDVLKIADKYFTFLKDSPGAVKIHLGDARLSLNHVREKKYDLFVIDAFSGDSVPAHLLTKEAIVKYQKHMKDDGLMLFHISNRYLNLKPVVAGSAAAIGAHVVFKSNKGSFKHMAYPSDWMGVTLNKSIADKLIDDFNWKPAEGGGERSGFRAWTDDYSNILSIIKYNSALRKN